MQVTKATPISALLRRLTLWTAVMLCALTLASPAAAHRDKLTVSTVEWNEAEQALEVSHRVHIDDAQRAMVKSGLLQEPDLHALSDQAKFALFLSEQFAVAGSKSDIPLETLGAEIDGPYIWVYQQATGQARPEKLYIDCQILRAVFPDQSNHVNVRTTKQVQTLTFAPGDGIKSAP